MFRPDDAYWHFVPPEHKADFTGFLFLPEVDWGMPVQVGWGRYLLYYCKGGCADCRHIYELPMPQDTDNVPPYSGSGGFQPAGSDTHG